jgi:ABC-type nitrate/sulfonate/bicarbonate transport system ATPase subunit
MRLVDVSFSYGDKQVLSHCDLTLPDQGITALSGPSGCGKTTLLRLLAGLEQPDSGTIEAPRRTAFLFQENRLLPELTAAQQVALVLPPEADPMPWLALAELETEANALPEQLSGGMQRRLALARCLAFGRDRELLLLDEPFTGVDEARIERLMERLRQLHLPVLLCAHDARSLSLADRVIDFAQVTHKSSHSV